MVRQIGQIRRISKWLIFLLVIPPLCTIWSVSWLAGRDRIAAVLLDYRTLKVQQVWAREVPRCAPFLRASDSQLVDASEDLLALHYGSVSFDHLGPVSLLTLGNGDFFGLAMLSPCDISPVFAGTITWSGRGQQAYPLASYSSDSLRLRDTGIGQPAEFVSLEAPWMRLSVEGSKSQEVWAIASRVEALATTRSSEVKVLVLLYPESVGPSDDATTHYVVFVMPK